MQQSNYGNNLLEILQRKGEELIECIHTMNEMRREGTCRYSPSSNTKLQGELKGKYNTHQTLISGVIKGKLRKPHIKMLIFIDSKIYTFSWYKVSEKAA